MKALSFYEFEKNDLSVYFHSIIDFYIFSENFIKIINEIRTV